MTAEGCGLRDEGRGVMVEVKGLRGEGCCEKLEGLGVKGDVRSVG